MYESSKPNARSLWGMLGIIFGLIVYALVIAALGSLIIDMSLWIQTPLYLVAGIIWIFPARKVFDWIARGKR